MVANLELLVVGVEAEAMYQLDNALVPALEIVEGEVGARSESPQAASSRARSLVKSVLNELQISSFF